MNKINSIFSKLTRKKLLLFSYLLCALYDLVSLVSIIIGGTIGDFLAIAIVVFCVNILFGALFYFVNPKMRYSVFYYLIYGIANVVYIIAMSTYVTSTHVFTNNAFLVFVIARVLALVFFIYSAVCCVIAGAEEIVFKNKKSVIAPICFTTLILATIVLSTILGFYGQGYGYKPLIYDYNETTDTYSVNGYLYSTKKAIKIPETFNGKKVVSYTCSIYSIDNVEKVIFENPNEKLEMTDALFLDAYGVYNDITVVADKSLFDDYKEEFYTLSQTYADNEHVLALANLMIPSGVAEDEVYISFEYDEETLTLCENKTLKTWFGKKGDTFSFDYSDVDYIRASDPTSLADMYWNYENNGQILLPITLKDGTTLENAVINASEDAVSVHLRHIYTVKINDDNDTIYTFPSNLLNPTVEEKTYDYWPYIEETAETLFNSFSVTRPGFTLTYYNGGNVVSSLNSSISAITPTWSITEVSVAVTSNQENFTCVYGDNITLTPVFTLEKDTELVASYVWKKGTANAGTDKNLTLSNIYPEAKGDYTLYLTLSSTNSNLTKTYDVTNTIVVNPKSLTVNWSIPNNLTYDGLNKITSGQISATLQGLINSDNPTVALDSTTNPIDVGNYTITSLIPVTYASKYTIPSPSKDITIGKKSVSLVWNSTNSFVYDGKAHNPTVASITGIVSGEENKVNSITYTNATNVGNYTCQANVASLTNYSVEASSLTKSYAIEKKDATLVWNSTNSFVYDGKAHNPTVASITGIVSGEENKVSSITYTSATNSGNYTCQANVSALSNYNIASASLKKDYSITKKALTISANNLTSTYDGTNSRTFSISCDGLAITDSVLEVVPNGSAYSGDATTAINVGTYTIIPPTANGTKANNYAITYVNGTLKIEKKALTITVDSKTKIYNGLVYDDFSYSASGLASKDKVTEIVSAYSGDAVSAINAGTYDISVETNGTKANNYDITIKSGKLTINKKSLTISANSASKTYDGAVYNGFTYTVNGLADTDKASDLFTAVNFSGSATTAINVGEYTIALSYVGGEATDNYTITTKTAKLTINKKALTLNWDTNSFVYDGNIHRPTVTSLTGAVASEEATILSGITYNNGNWSVGSYTVTASISNNNYSISNPTYSYQIVKGGN